MVLVGRRHLESEHGHWRELAPQPRQCARALVSRS